MATACPANPKLSLRSLNKERALGQQLAKDFETAVRLSTDPLVTTYVANIAERLVKNCPGSPGLTVRVVADDSVNAYSFPGGFVYVNTGLIIAAENEAQLASVIAHELAHVAARHASRNASKQELIDIGIAPANLLPGPAAYALQKLRGAILQVIHRNAEEQADTLALDYEAAAGYDPREFPTFLEKLSRAEGEAGCGSEFSSCADRIKRVERALRRFPSRTARISPVGDFQQIQARLLQ